MINFLTEQCAGAFPFWLAQVRVTTLPIAGRHVDEANALAIKGPAPLRGSGSKETGLQAPKGLPKVAGG